MIAARLLPALFILTPAIVLMSGMAMTPLLVILGLLVLIAIPATARKTPSAHFASAKYILGCMALMLALPLISTLWSFTPEVSLSTTLRAIPLCILGLAAITYAPALPALTPRQQRACAITIAIVSLIVLQEWATGGATDIDKLTFACTGHHKLLDHGWTTKKLANGDTQWIPPPQLPLPGGTNTYHHPDRLLPKKPKRPRRGYPGSGPTGGPPTQPGEAPPGRV